MTYKEMIEIKLLNKTALRSYIDSETFQNAPVIAISKHRAASQISNPEATEDDILLLIAFENDNMVGYLGVLPDKIFTQKNEKIHCGWMSCLWVDPAHRGKKIAQKLIEACFNSWNGNILLTEYTDSAGALYRKTQLFDSPLKKEGRRWYVRADMQTILSPKNAVFKKSEPFLQVIDAGINIILDFLSIFTRTKREGCQYNFVSSIDDEVYSFILSNRRNEIFGRNQIDLNWILQNPWIIENDKIDSDANKYHFTAGAKKFDCRGVEIRNADNVLIAFFIFTNRNGHFRLPYLYHNGDLERIRLVCRDLISTLKIKTCTIYQPELLEYFNQKPMVGTLNKKLIRSYLISKTLTTQNLKSDFFIQDGDGDCAFT